MTQMGQTPGIAPYYEVRQPVNKMVVRNLNFHYGGIQAL